MTCSNVMYFAICMVLFSSVAMAVDHIVGDEKGWTVDVNYTQWAQDKVFRVGDNLGKYLITCKFLYIELAI